MDNVDFTRSLCEKITPLVEPLSHHINLNVFGYRRFFPDGTCFNASSNFEWTRFVQEQLSNKIVPNYEKEVLLTLKEGKRFFLRIGEPDRQDPFLSMLYECDVWNVLSFYKKKEDCVEAFYITSTRDNYKIVSEYFNSIELFENFSYYFKDKINDLVSLQDMKKASALIISPQVFKKSTTKKD